MKTALILICTNILLALLLVLAMNACRDYKARYFAYRTGYEFQGKIVDSLRNRAAIDCEKRIEKALNRTHIYENAPDRPIKPDFLK